ncbi:MAG: ParB/RepB/Spo0J family partition protein [Frankiales bacterium]|nr:ParB/RepB/Spo0J family partition protein [Frankiales bacterium]
MNQKRGLGRGLGALIPTATREEPPAEAAGPAVVTVDATHPAPPADPHGQEGLAPVAGVRYAEVALDDVRPNPRQPRTVFDEEALAELVHSIREIGLLQPIVVRPVAEPGGPRYELVAGERRWRAAREAGLDPIPAIVRETADDDLLRDALLENLHRSQLNALEEAAAYQQMLEDFGCTQEVLAARIGRSRPQVSNTLRLLRLPAPVQRRVAAGVLSAGHARALLSLDDPAAMDAMATRIVAEGLSVRAVEEIVAVGEADGRERARVARPRRPQAPGLSDIADRLSDRLETRVRVEAGRSKGRVTIEFATLDDLRRIVDLIDGEQHTS